MPARTAHNHLKAPAAQGLGDNRIGARTVEHHAVGNRILPARRGKNVPHAAQIALTFFAHITDKHKRQRVPQPNHSQQRGNPKHRRHARAVVGNSRPIQPAALLPDVERSVRGKYGIDVRAQRHIPLPKSRFHEPEPGMHAKHVAHIVNANIVESGFAKALRQPGSARRLPKRRGCNPRHLHLPLRQLRLLRPQPVVSRPHLRRSRQPRHFLLHRGSNLRHVRAWGSRAHWKLCVILQRVARGRDGRGRDGVTGRGCVRLRQPALHVSRSPFHHNHQLLRRRNLDTMAASAAQDRSRNRV